MNRHRMWRYLGICLLALGGGVGIAAEPLPRVFYSPEERALITARRTGAASPAAWASMGRESAAAGEGVRTANRRRDPGAGSRVDGIVLGRGVRSAAWIGAERVVDGGAWGRYRLRVDRDGVVLFADDGSRRRVPVGKELVP